MPIIALIMYLPHAWLLVIDYPWNGHRWLWIGLWPLLPGLPFMMVERFVLGFRLPEWLELVVMGVFACGQLVLLSWIASRSMRWTIVIVIALLPLSIWLGIASHALFRM